MPRFQPDIDGSLQWFVDTTLSLVSWLTQNVTDPRTGLVTSTQNVFKEDPGVVYDGPKPYAVWLAPRHTAANRESGEVGNVQGMPNIYTLSYRETPYEKSSNQKASMARAYLTYCLLAGYLVKPIDDDSSPCPPQGIKIVSVHEEHAIDAQYIDTPAGAFVGTTIMVLVEERYP